MEVMNMTNNKRRKCIGVVLSKPDRKYNSDILKGIYQSAFKNDLNVVVFYVSTARGSAEYQRGEFEIFSLISKEGIDALIYLQETFFYEKTDDILTKKLCDKVRSLGIFMVTIDKEIKGFPCIYGQSDSIVEIAVEHLTKVHKCTDIAYMTGRRGHTYAEYCKDLWVYKFMYIRYSLPPIVTWTLFKMPSLS